MKIEVRREHQLPTCTIGSLSIDGQRVCWTLEDVVREVPGQPVSAWKIPGQTAIPRGTYMLVVDHSAHFDRDLPHILDVPGYEGVRIHPGNTSADTEGCILLGDTWEGGDFVGQSRVAFGRVFPLILRAFDASEAITLVVA